MLLEETSTILTSFSEITLTTRLLHLQQHKFHLLKRGKYPASLSGPLYPEWIPVFSEKMLSELIKRHAVNDVFFSYSDVSYNDLMELALITMAEGALFHLLGPEDTMIASEKPVIAVVA